MTKYQTYGTLYHNLWLKSSIGSHENPEGIRYRLAYIPAGAGSPAVLYDNHHPKGHHKHIRGVESVYDFVDWEKLIEDFEKDKEAHENL
ncbi:MAG: DUF6516 family protein [Elusimicrobiota bacterium]